MRSYHVEDPGKGLISHLPHEVPLSGRGQGKGASAPIISRALARLLLLWLAGIALAAAQPYPAKPVRIVVGFAPGGPSDIVARIVAQQLTERLGRSVVVENRPGATGMIGAELVARGPADGYSLYLASQTTHAVAPYMYGKAPYDPIRDFSAVVLVAHNPLLVVVHPSLSVKSIRELIALAKARPGELNFATGGIGSSPHMSMELLKSMAGINMVAVHYKGDGAAVSDLVGGQVPIMSASIAGLLQYVKAGKLRGLAVTSAKRSAVAPEFPTVAESGLPGFEVITWFGLLAAAGTPADIVGKLNTEVLQSLAQPAVKEQIAKLGLEIDGTSAEQFAVFLKEENVKWGKMVRALQLKAE
ncbi:MAG TPA: tripartite tricarboxylate transporter substrate binding protein [Burkholderiales bacterium]|nr:tripartite tricarboxylate transporter substrate binding protein [Burkholderiales bacterium]